MKVSVRLINDSKYPEELQESVITCRMDIENAKRVYEYVALILRKEDEKYLKYYKNGVKE